MKDAQKQRIRDTLLGNIRDHGLSDLHAYMEDAIYDLVKTFEMDKRDAGRAVVVWLIDAGHLDDEPDEEEEGEDDEGEEDDKKESNVD